LLKLLLLLLLLLGTCSQQLSCDSRVLCCCFKAMASLVYDSSSSSIPTCRRARAGVVTQLCRAHSRLRLLLLLLWCTLLHAGL
jgi:hypothetical protein